MVVDDLRDFTAKEGVHDAVRGQVLRAAVNVNVVVGHGRVVIADVAFRADVFLVVLLRHLA